MTARTVIRANGLAIYCVPKNANSSIRRAVLAGLGLDFQQQENHHHPALRLGPVADYKAFRVAFLRHPLDRLVSCWADKVARRKPGGSAALERAGFRIGMPFHEFLAALPDRRDRDPHTRPQTAFLPSRVDLLGRVETIEDSWSRLRALAPWLPMLGLWNSSPRRAEWRTYYDRRTQALAESLYAEDLAAWEGARRAERNLQNLQISRPGAAA